MTQPTFSLIIPTKRRPNEIRDVLTNLRDQTETFEVVLFNDERDEETETIVNLDWPFEIKYLYSEQNSNSCRSRNACLEKATGDWIVFLDDDLVIEPNFLTWVNEQSLTYDCFTPQIILPPNKTKTRGWFKQFTQSHWTGKTLKWLGFFVAGFDQKITKPIPVEHMVGATMIFKHSLVKDVRFDEWIGEGTGYLDDTDFTHSVRARHNTQPYLLPGYTMMHLQASSGGNREHDPKRWFYYYQAHKIYFFRKHIPIALPSVVLISAVEATLRSFQKRSNLLSTYVRATIAGLSQKS
ncbi:glycosyltransferase family 2 protein [Candidatus Uhrbacteria bacterium]|jgi:glycosyltransferase involved in cell wall biosynthesis|nr:glycosyltransferase family 2 protein [Candidatus Uhrbacteria bacterium]